jgi:hypothetical protein
MLCFKKIGNCAGLGLSRGVGPLGITLGAILGWQGCSSFQPVAGSLNRSFWISPTSGGWFSADKAEGFDSKKVQKQGWPFVSQVALGSDGWLGIELSKEGVEAAPGVKCLELKTVYRSFIVPNAIIEEGVCQISKMADCKQKIGLVSFCDDQKRFHFETSKPVPAGSYQVALDLTARGQAYLDKSAANQKNSAPQAVGLGVKLTVDYRQPNFGNQTGASPDLALIPGGANTPLSDTLDPAAGIASKWILLGPDASGAHDFMIQLTGSLPLELKGTLYHGQENAQGMIQVGPVYGYVTPGKPTSVSLKKDGVLLLHVETKRFAPKMTFNLIYKPVAPNANKETLASKESYAIADIVPISENVSNLTFRSAEPLQIGTVMMVFEVVNLGKKGNQLKKLGECEIIAFSAGEADCKISVAHLPPLKKLILKR